MIRNIYIRDCIDEVTPQMLGKFPELAKSVRYRKKGVLTFQVLTSEELVFFGFEVDEYRNQMQPNNKKVNVTVLDSVKLGAPNSQIIRKFQHL